MTMQLGYFLKRLKAYQGVLTKQQYAVLKGQALSGDLTGAAKGLQTILTRRTSCGDTKN